MSPTYGPELYVWVGLSTDTKPSSAYEGQLAIETDTNSIYKWFGNKDGGSWVKIVDGGYFLTKPLGYDVTNNAQYQIDFFEHQINQGNAYITSDNDADFDTSQTVSISFKTPNTSKWLHAVPICACSVKGRFQILKNPTITVDSGVIKTALNLNQNSANTSLVLSIETVPVVGDLNVDATITDDGTILYTELIDAPEGNSGAASKEISKIVLEPDTIYSFLLEALEDNGAGNIILRWYEFENLA